MISDLGAHWPVLVLVAPIAAVIIALLSWLLRHTVNQLLQRIGSQDERIKDMATQNGTISSELAETREQLVELRSRHNALVEKVDSGFERIETDIDRLKTTIVDVRLGMKDLQVNNSGPTEGAK